MAEEKVNIKWNEVAIVGGKPHKERGVGDYKKMLKNAIQIAEAFYPYVLRDNKGGTPSNQLKSKWVKSICPDSQGKAAAQKILRTVLWSDSKWVFVYYTGHGCRGGGWELSNGTLSWDDMSRLIKRRGKNVGLFLDCCYSGDWAKKLRGLVGAVENIFVFAASLPNETSLSFWGLKDGKTDYNKFMYTPSAVPGSLKWTQIIQEMCKVARGQKPDLASDSLGYGCFGMIDEKGKYYYSEKKSIHN
eukprot:275442_1